MYLNKAKTRLTNQKQVFKIEVGAGVNRFMMSVESQMRLVCVVVDRFKDARGSVTLELPTFSHCFQVDGFVDRLSETGYGLGCGNFIIVEVEVDWNIKNVL